MITIRHQQTVQVWQSTPADKSVKELAGLLGRSDRYVNLMKVAGFPMRWDFRSRCFVATLESARAWIIQQNFRVVNGKAHKGVEK